jgi:hypothetical protein
MNKKLFVGAMALTVVTVAGIKYYSWIKTKALEFVTGLKGEEEWEDSLLDTEDDPGLEVKVTRPEEDRFNG